MITAEQVTGLTQAHLTNIKVGDKTFWVHGDLKAPLQHLIADAKANGFDFAIASSFRDFHRQKAIWEQKYSGQRPILDNDSQPLDPSTLTEMEKIHAIMRWSALPGASRHHWGTDLDVYASNCLPKNTSLQLEPWEYDTGHQQEFSQWLQQAMHKHGFYLPYQEDLGGVAREPWHISYGKTSQLMFEYSNIACLKKVWQTHPFLGSELVVDNIESLYQRFIANVAVFPNDSI